MSEANGKVPKGPRRIYIDEMAKDVLGRAAHTVRQWIREGLPPELEPQREGGRQKIFWTEDQIPGLKLFAAEREERRGWQPSAT